MKDIAKRVLKISYLAGATVAILLLLKRHPGWAAGLMIGVVWCVTNYLLTINLFEMALLEKDPKRLAGILIIKFPVLYLSGFFILKYKLFPAMSLLTGIGLTLLIIGVVNLWPKRA